MEYTIKQICFLQKILRLLLFSMLMTLRYAILWKYKKNTVTAVYWVLADVPALLRSSLTSIFLAILCKADDVKKFVYSTVLEPLLKDLVTLEE